MTARAAMQEFNSIATRLLEEGLAIDINTSRMVSLSGSVTRVTWMNADESSISPGGHEGTIGEYLRLVRHRQFTAMMMDGALIQLSQSFDRENLFEHRYVLIPCPVSLSGLWPREASIPPEYPVDPDDDGDPQSGASNESEDMNHNPEMGMDEAFAFDEIKDDEMGDPSGFDFRDVLATVLIEELQPDRHMIGDDLTGTITKPASTDEPWPIPPRLRFRPTLRFDYDPNNAATGHPGSHLHFLGEDSRLPTYGPLSVGHFIRFIFRHAYPELWAQHSFLREWPIQRGTRSITKEDTDQIFLDCHAGG